jgi:hypothetical protein
MNLQGLLFSLLVVSAVAMGMGTFFVGTAVPYNKDLTGLSTFNATYNHFNDVNNRFTDINNYFSNTNLINPLTWGNLIGIAGSVVAIMANVPGVFVTFTSDIVSSTTFIPAWVIGFVEALILGIIVFAAINFLIGTGGNV